MEEWLRKRGENKDRDRREREVGERRGRGLRIE